MPSYLSFTAAGYTLLETLIALVLGLILLSGIVQVYLHNKQNYQAQQGLARIQEQGRTAFYVLQKALRSAGYIGCARLTASFPPITTHFSKPAIDFSAINSLHGYTAQQAVANFGLAAKGNTAIVPTSDVIAVQRMSEVVADVMAITGNTLYLSPWPKFKPGDVLIISDCLQASIFKVLKATLIGDKQEIITDALLAPFANYAQVGKLISQLYFVAHTGRKNRTGQPIYALYSQELLAAKQELVEGIENMQVQYAVNPTEITPMEYHRADEISDWQQVEAVKIALLIDSIDEVNDRPAAYQFAGQTLSAMDRLMRSQWIKDITLRERTS